MKTFPNSDKEKPGKTPVVGGVGGLFSDRARANYPLFFFSQLDMLSLQAREPGYVMVNLSRIFTK